MRAAGLRGDCGQFVKIPSIRGGAFLRMLSGGVAAQALLSAANFAAGLLMVRRTSDEQYGYYVLILATSLLLTSLQCAFIQPPLIQRLARGDVRQRAHLVGSLRRDQRGFAPLVACAAALVGAMMWWRGALTLDMAVIIACGAAAMIASLYREFMRMTLLAYRQAGAVVLPDLVFGVVLVAVVALSTWTPHPAGVAALGFAVASVVGGVAMSRALWRFEPWEPSAPGGSLRMILPEGVWTAGGSGVHWLFGQGYNYLAVAMFDVAAVAALAATRLLAMPVQLLSTGVSALTLSTATQWNRHLEPPQVLRRLALLATAVASAAAFYLLLIWLARDWVFAQVLHKDPQRRDLLLLLWSLIALVMVYRDQIIHFLLARAQFRLSFMMTLMSAVLALIVSFLSMKYFGPAGALLGLLAGECTNVLGNVVLAMRVIRRGARSHSP